MKYEKVIIKEDGSNLPAIKGTYYFGWDKSESVMNEGILKIEYDPDLCDKLSYVEGYEFFFQPLPEQESKSVEEKDRIYFTDNIEFLGILTEWCFLYNISFSGRESSVITSAVNEYVQSHPEAREMPSDDFDAILEILQKNTYPTEEYNPTVLHYGGAVNGILEWMHNKLK